ncbi:unnamed protein product [Clonostachys rosea]|uniref:Ricin B lectin n=1 Tax=Bionectria ochroleuca TaxID=29856 RepID=A0ABY6UVU1_BIOOC|nr:unnamed protein product [Clonostachys rosea]
MRFSMLASVATSASHASAALTWSLVKASNPTSDQTDAYGRIEAAIKLAVARHAKYSDVSKSLTIHYDPSVTTAQGSYSGDISFGANRAYMTERTALHEIAHTLGVGQTSDFVELCDSGDWPTALPLLRSWDGSDAVIHCGGGHFWPYGLNYDSEWTETNANRHVRMVDAMLADGM